MAVDSYLVLTRYNGSAYGSALTTESQVSPSFTQDLASFPVIPSTLLEIADYTFGVEQTTSIGSQGSGAGAGKISFDGLAITKRVDVLSPTLLQYCAAGTPFARVDLLLVKSSGAGPAAALFLQYTLKLAAIRTITTAHDDESPIETVVFDYGDLQIRYAQQNPDGSLRKPVVAGWNRVRNVADTGTAPI